MTTYDNVFSIFPILASFLAFASFVLDNTTLIRIAGGLISGCWLVYAIIYKSYSGMVCETAIIISTIIAIIKNSSLHKQKNNV